MTKPFRDSDWDFPPVPFSRRVLEPTPDSKWAIKTEIATAQFSLERDGWEARTESGEFILADPDWLKVLKGLELRGYKCQVRLCGKDNSHLDGHDPK